MRSGLAARLSLIIAPILVILTIALFSNALLRGKVADTDSFYHIKHSWIYRTTGIFQTAFPWTQYSVINKYSSDIWYGFHILTIPLTYFSAEGGSSSGGQDLLSGIRVGAVITAAISLLLVFLAFKILGVKWPLFWLLVFAFASPDVLYRLSMLRPHPLSLGLALLLFAHLVNSKSEARNELIKHEIRSTKSEAISNYQNSNDQNGFGYLNIRILDLFRISNFEFRIFLISAVFSWIHLALSWLPLLIAIAIIAFQVLFKEKVDWAKIAAVPAGILLGLLSRPNPFGAAKLAYIQIFQLLSEKGDAPLRFGRELTPFVWENFVDQLIPISLIVIIAGGFILWLVKRKEWQSSPSSFKVASLAGLSLSLLFFALTFLVARRSNELFIGFAVVFIAVVFTYWQKNRQQKPGGWASIVLTIAVLAFFFMPFKTVYRFQTYTENIRDVNRFKESAIWLKANTQPKEIVFNIHWDRFAQLFFWNDKNYYINGMDPIFEYAYDPALYWKTHFLAIDAATSFTCGKVRCTQQETEDTRQVLKNDFKASYLTIEKRRNPKFYKYLETADGFKKVFENSDEAVFKIT